MTTWIYLSLILNIVVLVPIVVLMALKSKIVDDTWGPFTAARGILWSIYVAILVVSIALLFLPIPAFVAALLSVQVIYKITTPFTVGRIGHPVVISNLAISAVHIATLSSIVGSMGTELVGLT
jgi:hypothetical protein